MWDRAVDLAGVLERALSGLGSAVAGAAPGWLVLGVVLHLANQVARGIGWHAIVRAAGADDPSLRRHDAAAAWVAGAGAGGVLSARGGDAVRVFLLARRTPRTGCACLAGTLVAEGLGEIALGALLLALATYVGIGPGLGSPGPAILGAVVAALAAGVLLVVAARSARFRAVAARVTAGCAVLGRPGFYARRVLPWQLASRLLRFAALGCFLVAFDLPATPAAVLLVSFAQGSARVLPFAPASVGAAVMALAATFGPVTGTAVPAGQLAMFFVGMSTVLTLAGVLLALAICARAASWRGLADAVRAARRRAVAPARTAA